MAAHFFLQAGSLVAIPALSETQNSDGGSGAGHLPAEPQHGPLHLQALDLTTAEGQFQLGLRIGNAVLAAIHGR